MAQDCTLILSGPAREEPRGPALVQGECPPALASLAGWRLEPDDRIRLSLVSAGGDELWVGLMTGPHQLEGHIAGDGVLAFERR